MKELVAERIKRLQEQLCEKGLDAALLYDRENLIYFAGVDDLEGGALAIPARGEPVLFCIWIEVEHMKKTSGIEKVVPYHFPTETQSTMMGKWLKEQGFTAPKIGFSRYFISVRDYLCLTDAAPDMEVIDLGVLFYQLRAIKAPEEIQRISIASRALEAGMEAAFSAAKAGLKEVDLLAEAEYAMTKAGSQGSSFRMQVLTHSRMMLKHPYASDAILEDNAPVLIHLGASYKGYVSKMCRTLFLGKPPEESVKIYQTLNALLDVALRDLRPGMTCHDLFEHVRAEVVKAGYDKNWVIEHIGYGVGIRQSEFYPIIAKNSPVVLEENMVIDLLLPTLYVPKFGGPRVTDTILVTKEGGKPLTNFPRELVYR